MSDTYKTIANQGEGIYKEKGSKFLSFAYPIRTEQEVKPIIDELKKQFYDARHHCYAWRLGNKGERTRANDDGEPSSTAGRPILGQILSLELTGVLVVVVRYFGGTKLGVSGLIQAYKESAAEALNTCDIVERTIDCTVKVRFEYILMNAIMGIIKDLQPDIIEQSFENDCSMTLSIRQSMIDILVAKLTNVRGATVEVLE